jgi:hypothetical protein
MRRGVSGVIFLVTLIAMPLAARSERTVCQVFIDNRGGRLVYHARQLVKIELDAYVHVEPMSPEMDNNAYFVWNVDAPTAAITDADPITPGRAFFYPGRRERKYAVTVRAWYLPNATSWYLPNAPAATRNVIRDKGSYCGSATQVILVENDYTHFVEAGGGWSQGSTGWSTRIANEFDGFGLPLLVAASASRFSPYGYPASQVAAQAGVKLMDQRVYLEVGYARRSTPQLDTGGVTVGLERLLDIDRSTSLAWSFGICLCTSNPLYYSLSGSYLLPADRMFLEGGIHGELDTEKYSQTTEFIMLGERL